MMTSIWVKGATVTNRTLTEQDRRALADRQLSLRRVSCKAHANNQQLLAKVYICAISDSYDDPASTTLVLSLSRNANIRDAVENRVLDAFDSDGEIRQEERADVETELLGLTRSALPHIDRLYFSATRILVRTETRSILTFSISEEEELIFPFSEVPRSITSLRPPSVDITALKRLGPTGRFGLAQGIDRVLCRGRDGIFAFKRAGRDSETTSHEIELLLHSPFPPDAKSRTLKLSAIVTDSRGRLRGFLSPFEPYGSLEELFANRRALPASRPGNGSGIGSVVFPRRPEWEEKLRWAAQLARAVATLHDGSATTGPITLRNLNPRNVLISGTASPSSCRETYIIIAGLRGASSPSGMRYFQRWAAPERLRKSTYEIGTALDVANLGMVLWALAEENFDRFPDIYNNPRRDSAASGSSRRGVPSPAGNSELWKKNDPSTPGWYRLLVESCIDEEPARRPKGAEVAATLERQLQFSQ